jgi:hypothetical protein
MEPLSQSGIFYQLFLGSIHVVVVRVRLANCSASLSALAHNDGSVKVEAAGDGRV